MDDLKEQLRLLVTGQKNAPTLRQLLRLGAEPALALLPGSRGEEDRKVRLGVALVLAHLLDPATVGALCELIQDEDAEVRHMAACALGLIGGEQALLSLLQVLEAEQDVGVIAQTVLRLADIGDARAIEPMQKLLEDTAFIDRSPSYMKRYIQNHLGQINSKQEPQT